MARWANPNDWTLVPPKTERHFEEISDYLRNQSELASEEGRLAEHREATFETLVSALLRVKKPKGLAPFLLVFCTDPSPGLKKLTISAAKRLNPPTLFKRWHLDLFGTTPKHR